MSLKERLSHLKTESVEVRGETVTVRELTAGQREKLVVVFRDNPAAAMAAVVAMCARDGSEPIWSEAEVADLPQDVVDAIGNAALRLSGLGGDDPND